MALRYLQFAAFLTLAALLPAASLAAQDGSAEAPFRYYSVLDGLTQSEVYDIEQDHAGYLWFTTARGLNRYDGKDFDQFTIADGLPTNSLTALHVDANNSVWVGDVRGGITLVHGARVVHAIAPTVEGAAPISDIESVGERIFAIAEDTSILEVVSQERQFAFATVAAGGAVAATNLVVVGTEIFAVAETGLYQLHISDQPRLELLDESIRRAAVDTSGTLWVVDENARAGIWRNRVFDPIVTISTEHEIVGIAAGHDGLIWLVTKAELFNFAGDGQTSEHVAPEVRRFNGIDEVTSLFVDRENSIWLSSLSRLIRFLGDRFIHYRLQTTSDSETVWSIAQDHSGRMWFGTQTKLLLQEADGTLSVFGTDHGIPEGAVRDVVADGAGNLWLGIEEQALVQFDLDSLTGRTIDGTNGFEILDIAMAGDGQIWFSTLASGVFRYSPANGELTRFKTPNDTSAYSVDIGPDGSIWYGADDVGLVRMRLTGNGAYESSIVDADGQLHNRYFDHIRLVDENTVWVATEEGGLYRYDNGEFERFGESTSLNDQTVYLVEQLDNGTVVVGGEQGLYQFRPGDPGLAHYNQRNGFIGLETNVHATFFDAEGYLWIGTVDGATRMDVSRQMPNEVEPTPTIVRLETELDRKQVFDGKVIEPGQLGAHVEFAAVSLLSPKGMQYSYKLDGVDAEWGPYTTNRSASYPRIRPGEYEFMVRARYPGGEWSREVASHRFTMLPFFWQQPWFTGLVILIGLLGIRAAMIYRTRQIRNLNEKLREQVAERTKSIEMARTKLEYSNELLSREVEARAELEARFRKAFENAPIGMALLDRDGNIFDSNPALRKMFWPNSVTAPEVRFADIVCEDDRDRFTTHYKKLLDSELDHIDEKLGCHAPDDGDDLQTLANLSPVRSDAGEFLYAVLQIQDVTESLKLTMQLEQQATSDELTGLLNRRAFEVMLEKAWNNSAAAKADSYLMFMDLDQFKVVNDTSGHTAGDHLLKGVTDILRDNVRNNDVVARLGGDEFGIILWECPTDVAARIAESIRASIENYRFHWEVETYRIGISIGGVPIDPKLGDIGELQQLADAACYAAKEAGRNRVHMVAGGKDSARVHRGQVRWVQRIREAMDNNRFAIYAQPIQPLNGLDDEPERLEILLRLRDPESRKLVPPGAFLPAAERYGMSVELDEWVVKSLLNALFIHQAFQANERNYWINLSGASIGDKRFATFLMDAIRHSPLPPGTINFEITETAVIRSIAEASSLMTALREMGCKFALDDFGSGLSSFGYLKKLPVDYLKIDGMFIRDLLRDKTDRIFVKSIIDIAHTLGIKTIAEFVENDELKNVVRELGADYGQGFAIGRPYVLAPRFPNVANSVIESATTRKIAG